MTLLHRLQGVWFRQRFLLRAAGRGFSPGRGMSFEVPVRAVGAGRLGIGDRVRFGHRLTPRSGSGEILLQAHTPESRVSVGDGSVFNNNVSLIAMGSITLGKDCLVGDSALIMDSDFHHLAPGCRREAGVSAHPVVVADNVWISTQAIVLKGVNQGEGAVIGAAAVVTRDVPPCCVVAGNPARLLRRLARETTPLKFTFGSERHDRWSGLTIAWRDPR